MDEDILCRTVLVYKRLMETEYRIVLGRKGRNTILHIKFIPEAFYHLSGLHKFSLKYLSLSGTSKQILSLVLDGAITADII